MSEWAVTKKERDIALASEDTNIGADDFDPDKIIECVAMWNFSVGAPNLDAKEIILIVKHLRENYPYLSVKDLYIASSLSLNGAFECKVECYRFSPLYVSTILNEYVKHRHETLMLLIGRRQYDNDKEAQEIQPTEYEERELFIECLRNEYAEFKESGLVSDGFSIIYNHLNATKRLKLSNAEINEALEYGRLMYVQQLHKTAGQSLRELASRFFPQGEGDKKEKIVKKFARNFTLQKFFSEINIDELVESIKSSEFIRK